MSKTDVITSESESGQNISIGCKLEYEKNPRKWIRDGRPKNMHLYFDMI